MWQFLPMLAGMLQGNQKQAEQQKHDKISAMLGQAPTAQGAAPQGGGGMGGALGALGKMVGGKPAPQEQSGDDMLQGLYGDKGNIDDEDLLNRGV